MAILLDVEDYLCVICREILADPVTLPCRHTCCLNCLERTLDNNKYQCFLCRKFIGSWYRNAKRRNELINRELSTEIHENFPALLHKKMIGESADVLQRTQPLKISSPGEIREEFDTFIGKIEEEIRIQQEKENKLSEEFIKQLQEEERLLELKQKEIVQCDEFMARVLASEMNADLQIVEKNEQIQVSSDEKLAKKLAFNENASIKQSFVHPKSDREHSFLKKPAFVRRSPLGKSKILSSKSDASNLKTIHSRTSTGNKFGPMDRFVVLGSKK